ncbi:hypothetical protein SNOG_05860 [Parastagonospora nodorum SN15]|uniref:Uncharacterized protein n=1 Tax=Phaeosphaeria nodorum (strain SN15 / ATCC MYA-4574 / FGSC 10173) TaxID=321614 RepID=Q0UQV4_PHANO|nr:hypothetical protein SNOG_05860 [Parastagonospora nodorum SN15]EAT86924.1 hypothetical protein SNOG_05860 [Parastagonospora nodorum SN15]
MHEGVARQPSAFSPQPSKVASAPTASTQPRMLWYFAHDEIDVLTLSIPSRNFHYGGVYICTIMTATSNDGMQDERSGNRVGNATSLPQKKHLAARFLTRLSTRLFKDNKRNVSNAVGLGLVQGPTKDESPAAKPRQKTFVLLPRNRHPKTDPSTTATGLFQNNSTDRPSRRKAYSVPAYGNSRWDVFTRRSLSLHSNRSSAHSSEPDDEIDVILASMCDLVDKHTKHLHLARRNMYMSSYYLDDVTELRGSLWRTMSAMPKSNKPQRKLYHTLVVLHDDLKQTFERNSQEFLHARRHSSSDDTLSPVRNLVNRHAQEYRMTLFQAINNEKSTHAKPPVLDGCLSRYLFFDMEKLQKAVTFVEKEVSGRPASHERHDPRLQITPGNIPEYERFVRAYVTTTCGLGYIGQSNDKKACGSDLILWYRERVRA